MVGLERAWEYLHQILGRRGIAVVFVPLPKAGPITSRLLKSRPKGTKLLCLVHEIDDAKKAAIQFRMSEAQVYKELYVDPDDTGPSSRGRTDVTRPGARVHGYGPRNKPFFFVWGMVWELGGKNGKIHPETFDSRLRAECLHELGHSLGLTHFTQGAERKNENDLMYKQPNVVDPSIRFIPYDEEQWLPNLAANFLRDDNGGV